MTLPHADWTLFLKIVKDLLNECESRMPGQDDDVLEGLERLHGARSGCDRIACFINSLKNPSDLETISKIRNLSETLQGVINCVEKKLYDIDSSFYVTSWFPEALVHRTGLVGRPRIAANLVQVEFLRSRCFSWKRITFPLCISRTTLWRRLKEIEYDFGADKYTIISDVSLSQEIRAIKGRKFRTTDPNNTQTDRVILGPSDTHEPTEKMRTTD